MDGDHGKPSVTCQEKPPRKRGYDWLVDIPTLDDQLGFAPFRRAVYDIIAQTPQTPFTIGIFGTWGSGKTSLMLMLQDDLERANRRSQGRDGAGRALYRVVTFDAWKYSQEQLLWRALLLRVLATLRPPDPPEQAEGKPTTEPDSTRQLREELDHLEGSLYRDVDWEEKGNLTVDYSEALKGAGAGLLKLGFAVLPGIGTVTHALRLADNALKAAQEKVGAGDVAADAATLFRAFRRDVVRHHQEHLDSLELFQKRFSELVRTRIMDQGQRLVLFVDDLDRCLPEKAVEVLEAIKLFLDVPGCVFVLGLERNVIEQGIRVKYKDFATVPGGSVPIVGSDYLEKIIQVPFNLPPIDSADIRAFICRAGLGQRKSSALRQALEANADIFATGLEANPRRIKRAMSTFRLLLSLAQYQVRGRKSNIVAGLLAKIVVIQNSFPKLYEVCVARTRLLLDLEEDVQKRGVEPEPGGPEPSPGTLVEQHGKDVRLRAMLALHPFFLEQADPIAAVRDHIYLTRTTREAGYVAPSVESDLWGDLVSGDPTRAQDAVARIGERRAVYLQRLRQVLRAGEEDAGQRAGATEALRWLARPEDPETEPMRVELASLLQDATIPLSVRLAAGGSLAYLRDPRDLEAMVEVPAGQFAYGSGAEQKNLPLESFKIGKYPVTNAQYQRFVDATGRAAPSHWEGKQLPAGLANHPVVNVSWKDARAYCQWAKKRLPTEQEWEKAARGTDGREWPWGNEFSSEKANTSEGGIAGTTPVGCYPDGASPYGCLDMAGNVWEWTESAHDKDTKVVRGGAWDGDSDSARCACRNGGDPDVRFDLLGFRVAE